MKPVISIIIPTLKEEQYLEKTLQNLASLEIPHEIIITDGGSKDRTLEIAKKYTDKVVVWDKERRQTFGEAKNAGAALAIGEFFVFIDADVTIPQPEKFFGEMLIVFNANRHLVAATVPLLPLPDTKYKVDRIFAAPLNYWYILSNNYFYAGNASGEFQMIRADAFKRVRGYHEHLIAGEDNNMFYRLGQIGRTISYSKLAVFHTFRRIRKLGWPQVYYNWLLNGFHVMFLRRSAFKEWEVIR